NLLFSHFFFFNVPSTTYIYTLSLHDALPISCRGQPDSIATQKRFSLLFPVASIKLLLASDPMERTRRESWLGRRRVGPVALALGDRKSTRLNSSHDQISYAVFCLKKKKKKIQ